MYVSVRDLPSCVHAALKAHGYHRQDIGMVAQDRVSISELGADGQRAYAVVINLATGQGQTFIGSWGGPNPFTPGNRVDTDTTPYAIPPNGMVIKGYEGGRTYATIYVHPGNVAKDLTAGTEVTKGERAVLEAFRLKAGPYRQQALRSVPDAASLIAGLVSRGLLKRSSNAATAITTEGKNALAGVAA